ncbi:MAG: flagellar hook-length control protein FliK [Methylophilaceae bacterium]
MQTSSLQPSPLATLTPAISSKTGNSLNEAEAAGSSFQDVLARQVNKTTAIEQQPASARPETNKPQKSQHKPAASADKATRQDSVAPAEVAEASAQADALDRTNLFLALAHGAQEAKDVKPAEADPALDTDASQDSDLLAAAVALVPLAPPTPAISAVAGQQAVDDAAAAINTAAFAGSPGSMAKADLRGGMDTGKSRAQPADTEALEREVPAAHRQQTSAANTPAAALSVPATSAAASKSELALAMHGAEKSMPADSTAPFASDAIPTGLGVFSLSAQAGVSAAAHSVGSANEIKAAPGSPAWNQAVGNKIVWMVGNAEQSASLTLNPPGLGPLQVIIKMQNDQASTTFISAHQEVRQALEAALPTLRSMMHDAGISLGQTSINMGNPQQQNFQEAGHQQTTKPAADPANAAVAGLSSAPAPAYTTRVSHGLVDTFA